MSTSVNTKRPGQHFASAALAIVLGFSATGLSQVAALPAPFALEHVRLPRAVQPADKASETRQAISVFLHGMAEADARTVWLFASEEDQAAFESEDAVLRAFVDAFPELTDAEEIKFDSFREEGDTPFWLLAFRDGSGVNHRAEVGLWRDDAGDWKVVSCMVYALQERFASLNADN